MKVRLDMDKIAKGLGARRRGKVAASGSCWPISRVDSASHQAADGRRMPAGPSGALCHSHRKR